MISKSFRVALVAAFAVSLATAWGQGTVGGPSGWNNSGSNGTFTYTSPNDDSEMTLTTLPAGVSLQRWMSTNYPAYGIQQLDTRNDEAGQPVTMLLAQIPGSGRMMVVLQTGRRLAGLQSHNFDSASRLMPELTKASQNWGGTKTSQSQSAGGNAAATGGSSGGGGVNVSSSSSTSPDGHYSVSSSSSSTTASSQSSQSNSQSNHSSQSNHDQNSDRNSQSNADRNTDHDSQTNRDHKSQSNSQANRQIVLDPGTKGFKLIETKPQTGNLFGGYGYDGGLSVHEGSPDMGPVSVQFRDGKVLVNMGGQEMSGKFAFDGDNLSLQFDGGQQTMPLLIIESEGGVVTRFAIGPCVFTRS